jgi:hypothetical protein
MKTDYVVYFEIYGKKLKTTVNAVDEIDAMDIVKSSINVVKVEKKPLFEKQKFEKSDSDILSGMDDVFDFFDLFKKKK